jgi:ATP-binding cassette, subfamily B, multidrug efflux pump
MSNQPRQMKGPGRGRGFAPGGSIKNLDKVALNRLMTYLAPYKGRLILVVICILISSGAGVASSLFLQTLIDTYIQPLLLAAHPEYSGLFHAMCVLALIYLAGVLAGLFYNRTMAVVSQHTLKDIRDEMFSHMQTLPVSYFDTHTHGDVMSYYTNDTDTLRQMISQSLPQLFSSVVTMVAVLLSMIHLSIWLTLIVLAFTVFMLVLVKKIAGKSGGYFVAQQRNLAALNGYIEEMINGQKVVKVFCHEEAACEEFDKKNDELRKSGSSANGMANMLMPLMSALGYVLYIIIAFAGGAMAIAGVANVSVGGEATLSLGTIAAFLTLSRNFVNPIAQVSQQLNSVVMAIAGAGRIFELLDQPSEEDHGTVTLVNVDERHWAWKDGDKLIPLEGDIELKDVDFGYIEGITVLHDISVYAKPGQKVALVGATGAGKTTITNLINRFYDIDDGKIKYDGININRIKKEDLRRSLGVVLQDVNLFTGTVMENIRYGNLYATDEECIAAAKLANADGFIRMLPNGYDTVLSGDGSGLSQGQRQLISIARCAASNPPVMILDEATSSIDTRTESIVQKGMDNLMKGRTVFVIAHRLSTVQNSDVIMVMEDGRIIERGNHDQLIAEKGKYYQLYNGAFELE